MFEAEILAPIPSAPGYMASNTGRVFGPRGPLSTPATKRGYLTCSVRASGKKVTTTVQRLVLEAFKGPAPSPAHEANHINGVKADNRPENLEWVTRQGNVDHAWANGLCKPPPKRKRPQPPEPGSVWCVVQIVGAAGVIHSRALYVPARGKRCDQHADADGRLVNATELGEWLRGAIPKRPSYREKRELRAMEWST